MKYNKSHILIPMFVIVSIMAFQLGRGKGRIDGYNEGCHDALDSVLTITCNQIKSDTSVSKVILINPDTFVFVLSPKTIRPKK